MSNFVEITPRELKPALLELDGISRASVHYLHGPQQQPVRDAEHRRRRADPYSHRDRGGCRKDGPGAERANREPDVRYR